MKLKIKSLAFLILIGCSSPQYLDRGQPYISRATAIDSVKVSVGQVNRSNGTYYVVPTSELRRVSAARYLTYLGTENGFHLLRLWTKILQNENEAWLFAVKVDSCNVVEPTTLEKEFQKYSANYRRVEYLPVCTVRKPERSEAMD